MKVFYPPKDYSRGKPLIFLAGPVQGAPNWQSKVIAWFKTNYPVDIACPKWHGDYESQHRWETTHLEKAALRGCVMFWLANFEYETPRRSFELAEWVTKYSMSIYNINIVIGIEPGFSNEQYIRRRVSALSRNEIDIYDDLENTCAAAAKKVKKINARSIKGRGITWL